MRLEHGRIFDVLLGRGGIKEKKGKKTLWWLRAAISSFLIFYALETPNICFMHDACDISRYVIDTVSSLTVDRFI